MKTVTLTFDESPEGAAAYRKFRKIAKRQNMSDADLARLCVNDALGALGVEINTVGHSRHNDFSDGEVKFIVKRYKALGPTETAKQLSRQYGYNRLPGTVRNKAIALGLVTS